MDGLSSAASVISVIQVAGRILSLCGNYIIAVKGAKNDIEHLHKEVKSVTGVLQKALSYFMVQMAQNSGLPRS